MDKYRTAELSKEQVKPEVTKLGVAHQILTQFTAFVAVEQKASRPEHLKAKHKTSANLMPKGSTMRAPNTATPATLFSIIGLLMIGLATIARRLSRKETVNATKLTGIKA